MADKMEASKGSDVLVDFCCSTCQDDDRSNTEAEFYCQLCAKFYCGQCLMPHSQLFKKHTTYGKGEKNKWPVPKATENFLEKCEVHMDRKLEMFCEDHSQLCCSTCMLLNHRQCAKVALIADFEKNSSNVDLQKLSAQIHYILKELTIIQNTQKSNSQSLQASYNDMLKELREVRKEINLALDKLENATLKEMNTMETEMKSSLNAVADSCIKIRDGLKQLSDMIPDIGDNNKHLTFLAHQKSLGKLIESERFLRDNSAHTEFVFKFHRNTEIMQYLSKMTGLGLLVHGRTLLSGASNQDKKIAVSGTKIEYNVKITGIDKGKDSNSCDIRSICCLSDGKILVADSANNMLKLLDQHYQMVSHCYVPPYVYDICQVDSNQVAVAVTGSDKHMIHMFTLKTGKLVKCMDYQLWHKCFGIAHHQNILFVTSGTSLYQYTMTGTRMRKLYEDTSTDCTVYKCAVSPNGDKLYVTNTPYHKLLTLDKDGRILCTFTDLDIQNPLAVHVAPGGQVLVCGNTSKTIVAVDWDGKKKIATLLTQQDGLLLPLSVCYCKSGTILVGELGRNNIMMFTVI